MSYVPLPNNEQARRCLRLRNERRGRLYAHILSLAVVAITFMSLIRAPELWLGEVFRDIVECALIVLLFQVAIPRIAVRDGETLQSDGVVVSANFELTALARVDKLGTASLLALTAMHALGVVLAISAVQAVAARYLQLGHFRFELDGRTHTTIRYVFRSRPPKPDEHGHIALLVDPKHPLWHNWVVD